MPATAPKASASTVRPSFVALLIAVTTVSPLGISIYLPSMPGMARALGTEFATIQLTLSLYLAVVALAQLIIGPLSDRFGRRPVLLTGLAVFVIGSLICLAATSVGVLILGRVVQAAGGCTGIALSRAIISDLYGRNQAASMIGYVTMGMAVTLVVAPSVGGMLELLSGWRASFAFLAAFGVLVLVGAYGRLHETNRETAGSDRQLLRNFADLARSRLFWAYTLTTSFSAAVYYALVAGASYVMVNQMGRTPVEAGAYLAVVSGGFILGTFLSGRFAGRVGPNRMILTGLLVVLAAILAMALVFAAGFDKHPAALFGLTFFVGLGNGLIMPSGIAGAVSIKPEAAGAASGMSGSLQMGFGAIVAPLVGAVLGATAWPLIAVMAACALLAIAAFGLAAGGYRTTANP